jgi:hypothetical protein
MTRINGVEVGFVPDSEPDPVLDVAPDPVALEAHRIETEAAEKLIEEDRKAHESGEISAAEILGTNSGARKFGELSEADVLGPNR